MNTLNKNLLLTILAFIFLAGIMFISYKMWLGFIGMMLLLVIIHFTNINYRLLTSLFTSFLLSFFLFQLTNLFIDHYDISREIKVLLKRSSLLIIITGLCLNQSLPKQRLSFFHRKPEWNNRIHFPSHSIKLSYFLLIGLLINIATFIPFILQKEVSYVKSILLFCLLFSFINSLFEEVIWRGILLASIKEYTSVFYAVFITSLGFGLQHITVGIPLYISVLFSFGGLFYAFVVLRTNSIYPSVLFHICINIGMVFSGFILS
ncbi:CPBP family intramembrane glutamic endopeptidase [Microbacteriaceae bacterium 4G12]